MTRRGHPPHPGPLGAYFLDFDGTLVHLVATPDRVRVDQALRRAVLRLHEAAGGAVALVTGRPLAEIDRHFAAPALPVAGQHGLERRTSTGRIVRGPAPSRRLAAVRAGLRARVAEHPGLLLEDKTLSLALHYRRTPQLAGYAHRLARIAAGRLGPGYVLRRGKRVVEIAPGGRDKGSAIAAFMRESPFLGRVPVFIGDDITDELGFRTVNRIGGLSIKVGPGPTMATWRLRDVRAVREWLAAIPHDERSDR